MSSQDDDNREVVVDDDIKDDAATATAIATEEPTYDWSAFYDDEGHIYYYNSVTEETSWDPPSDGLFHPPIHDSEQTQELNIDGEENNVNTEMEENRHDKETNTTTATEDDDIATSKENTAMEEVSDTKDVQHDWSAYYDDEGRIYYYNSKTDESVWEPPEEGFNPPEIDADDTNNNVDSTADIETSHTNEDDSVNNKASAAETIATVKDASKTDDDKMQATTPWSAYEDDEGRTYYYNSETGETQWDAPDSYQHASTSTDDSNEKNEAPVDSNVSTDEAHSHDIPMDDVQDDDDVLVMNAEKLAQERLRNAEDMITSPDSILEPKCMDYVSEIVKADDGNATRAISALIDHYHGQTAICGLLVRWNLDLSKTTARQPMKSAGPEQASKKQSSEINNNDDDYIRTVIRNTISKVAKDKYNKQAGDGILDLAKSEVTFLEDMIDSPHWRKLLIELSAEHKDSAVLLYCLRAISNRGHHREIATLISPSDHFAVFNAMLLSEFAMIGQQATSAQSDVATATKFHDYVRDIIKASTLASYTYLYTVHMLRTLIQSAKIKLATMSQSNTNGNSINISSADKSHRSFQRAILKWENLLQLLESSMLDSSNLSVSDSSPLIRRRRVETALTISSVYQRQNKKKRVHDDISNTLETNKKQDLLEAAILTLLRRHSLGIQIDESVLNKLLPLGLDMETYGVGKLLLQHPTAVKALIEHLYKPGPTRVTSLSTKKKCARLIALCTIAAETSAREQHSIKGFDVHLDEQNSDKRELTLTDQILQGSLYCETLETMVSFFVTTSNTNLTELRLKQSSITTGERLCLLALSVTPIGLGVAIWARQLTLGPEYAASASYPTLSFSVLSLVRLVASKHPFARHDALQTGLTFLRHSNSDISYQKVNAIKECALRLLVSLLCLGDIVPVFSSLTVRVQQVGSSELDASLIRYFVCCVLEVVKSPISPLFMRMFGLFLMSQSVTDAVRSSYFPESDRKRLLDLMDTFSASYKTNNKCDCAVGKEMPTFLSNLLSVYR